MRKLFRDPLCHFLVLGAGLFIAMSAMSRPGPDADASRVVITRARVEHLATVFATTFQRPATDAELKALIDNWIREEIAVREAVALKLDQDDTVVRRRLRQKFEFVSEGFAGQIEPTDAELDAYLKTHADTFRFEPRLTFTQVYLSPDKRGRNLQADAARLLARLRAGEVPDVSQVGDLLLLEPQFTASPAGEVAKQFGQQFADALVRLEPGQWQGPVASSYGAHLVKVDHRIEGHLPALADVRDAVRREWANARRLEMNDKVYQALLKDRYTVMFESPEPPPEQKKVMAR